MTQSTFTSVTRLPMYEALKSFPVATAVRSVRIPRQSGCLHLHAVAHYFELLRRQPIAVRIVRLPDRVGIRAESVIVHSPVATAVQCPSR